MIPDNLGFLINLKKRSHAKTWSEFLQNFLLCAPDSLVSVLSVLCVSVQNSFKLAEVRLLVNFAFLTSFIDPNDLIEIVSPSFVETLD